MHGQAPTLPPKQLAAIWPVKQKYASITWQVNDVCNFSCSYCNPGNYSSKHKNIKTELYIENVKRMVEYFRNQGYESFRFFFSGGEPSIWPSLVPILQYIRKDIPGALVAINTNLSRPLDWWKEHYTLFNDIVASYHVEFTDKDSYLENMLFLQDKMDYLVCRMLMHDERFQEVVDFTNVLKSKLDNYIIEYAPLLEMMTAHSVMHEYRDEWKREFLKAHTYEQQKKREKVPGVPSHNPAYSEDVFADGTTGAHNSNRIVAEGKNDFRGWKCWINDAIHITPAGEIRVASCDMGGIIGNMNMRGIRFATGPVICQQERCNCGTDIGIRKCHPDFVPSEEQ
jgi:organic radical activating enzyme